MAGSASETTPLINTEREEAGGGTGAGGKPTRYSVFKGFVQPSLAEMFGTTLFVFAGTLSVVTGNGLAVGLAHGLGLAVVVAGLGSISGGHINPAVTLGVWIGGGIRTTLAVCYVFAQLIGGIIGAACCRGVLNYPDPTKSTEGIYYNATAIKGGAHQLGEDVTLGCAVFCEVMLTLILVTTVLMTAVDSGGRNVSAPLLIGFSVAVDIVAGGTISGASMNPARSFGPAVMMSDLDSSLWDNHWVYWVGPLAGAFVAGVLYRVIFASSDRRIALKED